MQTRSLSFCFPGQACQRMMHNAELWAQLCDTYDSLQAQAFRYNNDGSGPVPAEPELLHKCTECDRGFSTQSSLRMHVSKVHTGKKKDRSIKVQDPEADARKHGTNGMPQCRYCGLQMQRWPNLNRHITLNRCEKYLAYLREEAPLPPEPQPLVENSEVLGAFRKSGRQYLLKNIPRWEEARTHCSICRQWIARQADFKSHLKKTHQALWSKYGARAEKLVTPTTLNGKCEICLQAASGNTKHKCPVLMQVQFAALIDGGRSDRYDGPTSIGEGATTIRRVVGETKAEEGSLARGGSQPRETGEQGIQDRSGREESRPGQERQRIQWKEQGRPSTGGQQPADQHDGETCNPTRGLMEPSESGPGFCLFLRTADSEETITKQLFQTSQTWKEHKAQNPQARRSPLRVVLFTMILQVLMDRAKQVLEDAEARKKAVEAQMIQMQEDGKGSAMPSWVYLDYNPSEKKEVTDQNTPPLDQDRLMRRLKAIQEHTHGEMVLRFHGLRPLAMEMEGDQYLMVLEISQSSKEALQVLADLRDLTNNSIWKLIGARFRRDRIQRSPLATRIAEMIKAPTFSSLCALSC